MVLDGVCQLHGKLVLRTCQKPVQDIPSHEAGFDGKRESLQEQDSTYHVNLIMSKLLQVGQTFPKRTFPKKTNFSQEDFS